MTHPVLIVESIITMLALVFGGVFSYFRFFKGRVFAHRAVPTITGEWMDTVRPTVRIRVSLQNVGASRLKLSPRGTVVRVHTINPVQLLPPAEVQWQHVLDADAFVARRGSESRRHDTVEAGEHINDELLLDVERPPGMATMLELWVELDRGRSGTGIVMARCVVAPTDQQSTS